MKNFVPLAFYDMRKLIGANIVFLVHCQYLDWKGSSKDLYYLQHVSYACLSNKQRISIHYLQDHAACRPNVNLSWVSSSSKDQLRCSVASCAYIWDIFLFRDQDFSWAKITYCSSVSFQEQVFGLYVSMTDV